MKNFFQVLLDPHRDSLSVSLSLSGFKSQVESVVSDPIRWKSAMNDARSQIKQLREIRLRAGVKKKRSGLGLANLWRAKGKEKIEA
jgi:hypothetical protein